MNRDSTHVDIYTGSGPGSGRSGGGGSYTYTSTGNTVNPAEMILANGQRYVIQIISSITGEGNCENVVVNSTGNTVNHHSSQSLNGSVRTSDGHSAHYNNSPYPNTTGSSSLLFSDSRHLSFQDTRRDQFSSPDPKFTPHPTDITSSPTIYPVADPQTMSQPMTSSRNAGSRTMSAAVMGTDLTAIDAAATNPKSPAIGPRAVSPPTMDARAMYPQNMDRQMMSLYLQAIQRTAWHAPMPSTGNGSSALQGSFPRYPEDIEERQQVNSPVNGGFMPNAGASVQAPIDQGNYTTQTMHLRHPEEDGEKRQYNALKDGCLVTKKKELTVLLVGETGVGKTAFLSLVSNILEGRDPSNYRTTYDLANETGGSKQGSQTGTARLYEFASLNGVKVRLLDTPGLADTRGVEYDTKHKASIAETIRDAIPVIDGVLIIANGTTERLQVATDYAITTLSSIFPRSIASNIGFLFTMISNVMAFNFQMESLPDCLQEAETFNLDNPIALRRKYEEIREKPKYVKQAKAMEKMVDEAHSTAVEMLAEFFDWLDKREIQPTTAIVDLYQSVCEIDRKIQNALARMNNMAEKRRDLEMIRVSMSQSEQGMKVYGEFETIMNRTIKVQTDTTDHNTVCGHPNCYSNCHTPCTLSFSLDPAHLVGCAAFGGNKYLPNCVRCHHPVADHHHYHSIWEDKVDTQVVADKDAKRNFKTASNSKSKYQDAVKNVQNAINSLDREIMDLTAKVGVLCQSYKELSLSGSFAGQISKSIRLFELNVGTLRANGADTKTIQSVIASINTMREKERVVKNAGDAIKKIHVVPSQPATKGRRGSS